MSNITREQMEFLLLNTRWSELVRIANDNIQHKHLLKHYTNVLFYSDSYKALIALSDLPTIHEKNSIIHTIQYISVDNCENFGRDKDEHAENATGFIDLVNKLTHELVRELNGFNSSEFANFGDDKTKFRRHYKGKSKAGVSLHRCSCCNQWFLTDDTLVANTDDRYECVIATTHTHDPVCPFCAYSIHDLLTSYNEEFVVIDYITKSLNLTKTTYPVVHVSIAPPDNGDYKAPMHNLDTAVHRDE